MLNVKPECIALIISGEFFMTIRIKKSLILATLLAFLPLSGFSNESANTPSKPKLDILWVVDNSGSMESFQNKLSASLDRFIEYLTLESKNDPIIDMALISTDTQDTTHKIAHNITYSATQAVSDFKHAIDQLGTRGSIDREQAFLPNITVLNKPFFPVRKDSNLAIIIVSDEKEHGAVLTPELFTNILHDNKDPDAVGIYGLLGMTEKGEKCGAAQYAGSRYEAVINATNGKAFSICRSFPYSLLKIAEQLVTRFNL